MNNTFRLLTLAFLLLSQISAFAQQENRKQASNPEAKAKRQTAEMKVRLNLNDDQTAKVYEVLLSREQELAQKRDLARQSNQTAQNKIESILNEDQKKEFTKMKEEKRERAKVRKGMNAAPQKDNGAPKNQ